MGLIHEVRDGNHRTRAAIAVIIGLVAGMCVAYLCMADLLFGESCSMLPSFGAMATGGALALILLFIAWWLASWVLYGLTLLPGDIVDGIRTRKITKESRIQRRKRFRELHGPIYFRALKNVGVGVLYVLVILAAIVVAGLVGYLVSYAFWAIYC